MLHRGSFFQDETLTDPKFEYMIAGRGVAMGPSPMVWSGSAAAPSQEKLRKTKENKGRSRKINENHGKLMKTRENNRITKENDGKQYENHGKP